MSLTITLYKNCILTNEYKEGFNMRISGILDTYLSALDKLQVYSGDEIYYTNSGTISIENTGLTAFTGNIYNYMVFQSTESGVTYKRYCFVNSVTLVNEVAVIQYEEDIWANYSSSMQIRYGNLISAKRLLTTGYDTFLPKGYESNKPVSLSDITIENQTLSPDECYVVIDLNFYTLSNGSPNRRLFASVLLGKKSQQVNPDDQTPIGSPTYSYTWRPDDDLARILCNIKAGCGVSQLAEKIYYGGVTINYNPSDPFFYDITRVLLIPADIGFALFDNAYLSNDDLQKTLENNLGGGFTGYFLEDQDSDPWPYKTINAIPYTLAIIGGGKQLGYLGMEGNEVLETSFTLANDYTIKGLQNESRFIPLTMNGKGNTIKFRYYSNIKGSSLCMNANDELIDITSDFVFNIPISTQTADITQQQSIADNLASFNNLTGGIMGFAGNYAQMGKQAFSKDLTGAVGSWAKGLLSLETMAMNDEAINAKKRLYNHAVSAFDTSLKNASIPFGFYVAKIDPTNSGDVSSYINKYGYSYDNILVSHSDVIDSVGQDNYLRFNSVHLYGAFSDNIAKQLQEILVNGIYIFGTSSV